MKNNKIVEDWVAKYGNNAEVDKIINERVEYMENGFMIVNGGIMEPLPEDLFDVPSKEREEEIIKHMVEELKRIIHE